MPPPRYFVRVEAEVRGPYDVDQLRQLAEVQVITPASDAARSRDGPWEKMATLADAVSIFPARAEIAFTAARFAATPLVWLMIALVSAGVAFIAQDNPAPSWRCLPPQPSVTVNAPASCACCDSPCTASVSRAVNGAPPT